MQSHWHAEPSWLSPILTLTQTLTLRPQGQCMPKACWLLMLTRGVFHLDHGTDRQNHRHNWMLYPCQLAWIIMAAARVVRCVIRVKWNSNYVCSVLCLAAQVLQLTGTVLKIYLDVNFVLLFHCASVCLKKGVKLNIELAQKAQTAISGNAEYSSLQIAITTLWQHEESSWINVYVVYPQN